MKRYKVLNQFEQEVAVDLNKADAEWICSKAVGKSFVVHPMETDTPYKPYPVTIRFDTLTPNATMPKRATRLAAGFDLCADFTNKPNFCLNKENNLVLLPGSTALIPTGVKATIKEGFEGQIRSRSGLSLKYGVVVLNSPGTIDADYEGEIKVVLINHGMTPFEIKQGTRIAQIVISHIYIGEAVYVKGRDASKHNSCQENNASEHTRGNKGLGSTGE